ncbi:Ig-like domain-containing protein, partial [Trichloromonas sp.]|uniref:Ig-like domain-containing protein n=1 Tax=Trichloromonas sp. TaxID=3069249 RepID=UPI003D819298
VQLQVHNPVDSEAPHVAFVGIVDGMTVGNRLTVRVQATDNESVSRVELYLDGMLQSVSSNSYLTARLNPRKLADGGHTLKALAYDAEGNAGEATATIYR